MTINNQCFVYKCERDNMRFHDIPNILEQSNYTLTSKIPCGLLSIRMNTLQSKHTPVMVYQVLHWLITDRNGIYFDGTLGDGGHATAIAGMLQKNGIVIATDHDEPAVKRMETLQRPFDAPILVFHNNFRDIPLVLMKAHVEKVDGILLDLGMSSRQLDDPARGFSYLHDGALDMRMDARLSKNAYDIINQCTEEELRDIFFQYGEEKRSARLARIIVEFRNYAPIKTTSDLTNIMKKQWKPRNFVKSASRIFQALRIAVNNELENLSHFFDECWNWLAPGGRIVVISYHSLEDRIVKQAFKQHENPCICPRDFPICTCGRIPDARILTRKAVRPSAEEIEKNPRARSAQLRAVEKVSR